MKRLIPIIFVALLAVTMLSVTVSAAPPVGKGAQIVPLYPCGPGQSDQVLTTQPAQGKVIINTPNRDVSFNFTVIANNLDPNTQYAVFVRELAGYTGPYFTWNNNYWFILGYFTTDSTRAGDFHLNVRAADLPSGAYNIQVALNPVSELMTHTVLATEKFTAVTLD
jgi:hypothetical protein